MTARIYKRHGPDGPGGQLLDTERGYRISIGAGDRYYDEYQALVASGDAVTPPGYVYQLAGFPTGKVDREKLTAEIAAKAGITTALSYIHFYDGKCEIFFASAIANGEKTALDQVCAAHIGPVVITLGASSKLVNASTNIVDVDWGQVGGVVTNPQFFSADLTKIFGRLVGSIKTGGAGVELRLLEQKEGAANVAMSAAFAVPDTGGNWAPFGFSSNVSPRDAGITDGNTYLLQGRLNAAPSASIRFTSLSLMLINKTP
jgi:hypothetical protein